MYGDCRSFYVKSRSDHAMSIVGNKYSKPLILQVHPMYLRAIFCACVQTRSWLLCFHSLSFQFYKVR